MAEANNFQWACIVYVGVWPPARFHLVWNGTITFVYSAVFGWDWDFGSIELWNHADRRMAAWVPKEVWKVVESYVGPQPEKEPIDWTNVNTETPPWVSSPSRFVWEPYRAKRQRRE